MAHSWSCDCSGAMMIRKVAEFKSFKGRQRLRRVNGAVRKPRQGYRRTHVSILWNAFANRVYESSAAAFGG